MALCTSSACAVQPIKHEQWFYIWALGWMVYIIARMTGAQCLIWRAGPNYRYRFIRGVGVRVLYACMDMCGYVGICVFFGVLFNSVTATATQKQAKIYGIEAMGWKCALSETIGRQHDRQSAVLCVYCQPPTHPQVSALLSPSYYLYTPPPPHLAASMDPTSTAYMRGKGRGAREGLRPVWQHFRIGAKPKREWSGPNPEPEHIGIGIISSVPHHYVHRFKHSRHHPSCHAMPWHAIAIAPVCVYVICDIVQFWLGHTYTRLPKHRMMRWGYLSLSTPPPTLWPPQPRIALVLHTRLFLHTPGFVVCFHRIHKIMYRSILRERIGVPSPNNWVTRPSAISTAPRPTYAQQPKTLPPNPNRENRADPVVGFSNNRCRRAPVVESLFRQKQAQHTQRPFTFRVSGEPPSFAHCGSLSQQIQQIAIPFCVDSTHGNSTTDQQIKPIKQTKKTKNNGRYLNRRHADLNGLNESNCPANCKYS